MEHDEHEASPVSRRDEFKALVELANSGDELALAELRELLDSRPDIWQQIGDLGRHAELAMINLIAGNNSLVRESLMRKIEEMKGELVGDDPSLLEKIAAQRVIATWLDVQYTATAYPEPKGETITEARFQLKLKDSAERRFNAAMKSLMLVQTLLPRMENNAPNRSLLGHRRACVG